MQRASSTPYPFETATGIQNPMHDSSTATSTTSVPNEAFRLSVPLREDDVLPESQTVSGSGAGSGQLTPSTSNASAQLEADDCDEDGEIDIQIRNVVCSYTLPFHIDLRRVALHNSSVTFDRGRGVLLKQKRHPSCFAKIYSSGKVYLVGCRSEKECKEAARGVARMLQRSMRKLDALVCMRHYRVCNVLATCKMPFGVKIEELAHQYPSESQYEPELSVGLVWRSTDPKATLRIHTTGSITVTGAVSEADIMRVIEFIYPKVRQFRCPFRFKTDRGDDEGTGGTPRKKCAKRKAAQNVQQPTNYASQMNTAQNLPKRPPMQIYSGQMQYTQYARITAPAVLRQTQTWSGAIGNRVYFSDEEDEFQDQA